MKKKEAMKKVEEREWRMYWLRKNNNKQEILKNRNCKIRKKRSDKEESSTKQMLRCVHVGFELEEEQANDLCTEHTRLA